MGKQKIAILCSFIVFASPVFSFQKLTTTQMRENAIRINALEIEEVDVTIPKIAVLLDEKSLKFEFGSWVIKNEYVPLIKDLKDFIMKNNYVLKIYGYTDSIGTEEYNSYLSLKRSESLRDKLIEVGLPSKKILEVKGMGEKDPVATNDTIEGRKKNRRVEFVLIKEDSQTIYDKTSLKKEEENE